MKDDGLVDRVRFGPYEADFYTQELWKDGTKLKLARQPFEILEELVSHPGELVAREELQRRLWPEDHFGDASHGLNAAINKLRDALGESADQPKYIETLPRRGYRFIGKVEGYVPGARVDQEIPEHLTTPPQLPPVPAALAASTIVLSRPRRWPILVAASAALVVASVIGIVLTEGVRNRNSAAVARSKEAVRKEQREMRENRVIEPEISAGDNRDFAKVGPSQPRPLPAGSLLRPEVHDVLRTAEFRTIISGDGGNAGPQFSPDGKRIAFMSSRSGPWQIWMSNADGSNPVQVSFTDSAGTPRWSPDGQSIVFDAPWDGSTFVFVAPINNPESARPLAEGRVPSFSCDGNFIYFASDRTGDWQVWKIPVKGEGEMQVSQSGGFAALESPDGNVYYSKSNFRNPEIWRVPIGGGAEVSLTPLVRPRTWSSWTVTRNGILLVVDLPDGKTHLNFYDPMRQTVHELAVLQTAPQWMGATSDGKKVVMNDAAERQITLLENLR